MVEFCEGADDVFWHVDVDPSLCVVPLECETAVDGAGPIYCYVVCGSEGIYEVVGVFAGEVFDSEVVDAEGEGCLAGGVFPEAGCVWHGLVSMWCEGLDQLVEYAGLLEAVHALPDLAVDETVWGDIDVVFVPDLLWDLGGWDS